MSKTKTVSIGPLTLGDLQLIHQGLSVIGEENRVDLKLLGNWRDLMRRTEGAVKRAIPRAPAQQADKETSDEMLREALGVVDGRVVEFHGDGPGAQLVRGLAARIRAALGKEEP